MDDPRVQGRVQRRVAAILRYRMLVDDMSSTAAGAAGYEDCNDAHSLRHHPVVKLALVSRPEGDPLCLQPTISRLENLPDVRALLRMVRTMVGMY